MSDEIKNPNTEEEYQPDLMTLEDEDGNEVTFEVIDALDHKGVHYLAVVEYAENEDDLDEDALVRVLKEPRNSLVKQYKELLGMDNVELTFTDEALHAIARKTIERKTGARGLRSVMEGILLPVMYDVPNDPTIIRVTIDKDTVEGGEAHLEYGAVRKRYKNQTALS